MIKLMVMSGFSNRTSMCEALSHCGVDMTWVARPVCALADAPAEFLDDSLEALPRLENRSYVFPTYYRFIKKNKFPCWLYGFAIEYWYNT